MTDRHIYKIYTDLWKIDISIIDDFLKKLKTNSIPNKNYNSIVAWDEFISDVFIGKCHDQWELKGQIFLGKMCFQNWGKPCPLLLTNHLSLYYKDSIGLNN